MLRVLLFSPLALLLIACAPTGVQPSSSVVACTLPRPQVCTMEYNPVCAEVAASQEQEEYSSPCNACAHDLVISYVQGSCLSAEQ